MKVKTLTSKNLIPEASIRRLSIYLRCLRLSAEKGEEVVSSSLLASRCNISESLIRRDLSYFGEFGIKGKGYKTKDLIAAIENILGIVDPIKIIVLGCGSLGRALIRHLKNIPYFNIIAAFDKDKNKCGKEEKGVKIYHIFKLPEIAKKEKPKMALISISSDSLQEVVDLLAENGIKAILSFTLSQIRKPPGVRLHFIDIAAEMEFLFYQINK